MVSDFDQLFYADSYQTVFSAKVTDQKSSDGKYWLALTQTCFYPEGGGQPGDQGEIFVSSLDSVDNNQDKQVIKVLHTILKDDIIWHQVSDLIPEGTEVQGEIDFNNRYDLMQQHSAEHIVSGIVNRKYGYDNVGFNINNEEMTFDFNGDLTWEQILEIEDEANQAVFKNIPIEIHYLTPEQQQSWTYRSKLELGENVRVVVVPNYDTCACAGTHLKTTGEIGQIKIIKRESYKGGVRLTALCGLRALKYFQKLHEVIQETGELLSANLDNLVELVKYNQTEILELKQEINKRNNAWLELYKKNISPNTQQIIIKNQIFNKNEWLYVCRYLFEKVEKFVCLLTEISAEKYMIFMYSETVDLRAKIPELKKTFDFKGGGNASSIQGPLIGDYQKIVKLLSEIA